MVHILLKIKTNILPKNEVAIKKPNSNSKMDARPSNAYMKSVHVHCRYLS